MEGNNQRLVTSLIHHKRRVHTENTVRLLHITPLRIFPSHYHHQSQTNHIFFTLSSPAPLPSLQLYFPLSPTIAPTPLYLPSLYLSLLLPFLSAHPLSSINSLFFKDSLVNKDVSLIDHPCELKVSHHNTSPILDLFNKIVFAVQK